MLKRIVKYVVLIICITCLIVGYIYFNKIFAPNIDLGGKKELYIYIYTGSDFEQVKNTFYSSNIIIKKKAFEWVAEKKKYPQLVKPGRYKLTDGMNNNELINMLRLGEQVPVLMTFNNVRTKAQLAGTISRQLEVDSITLKQLLNNNDFLKKNKMDEKSSITLFIPNTYELWWSTSSEKLFERMALEYKKFWTKERKQKSKSLNLSQTEVAILASIVQAEQQTHPDERPVIAGLYVNRLKKKMRLESDPTLVFAHGDFSIKRVLNKHKEIDSPYNTYKNEGLPPGPINLPEPSSIDAVLNYKKNDYLFMCAKPDFSGYHNFAKTLKQHNINARKYREALNKKGVLR